MFDAESLSTLYYIGLHGNERQGDMKKKIHILNYFYCIPSFPIVSCGYNKLYY